MAQDWRNERIAELKAELAVRDEQLATANGRVAPRFLLGATTALRAVVRLPFDRTATVAEENACSTAR